MKTTLKALKTKATRDERIRVFDNMNLPPRDITVEYQGRTYIRHAWQNGKNFGWSRWQLSTIRAIAQQEKS